MNKEHEQFKVTVHYVAAGEPFKDNAARTETVGHLKQRVLVFFGLLENEALGGNTSTYTLYHQKTPLEDMNQALGEIPGEQEVLQLKLSQQIIQG